MKSLLIILSSYLMGPYFLCAQVVYTDIYPDREINVTTIPSTSIDFDGDSNHELSIKVVNEEVIIQGLPFTHKNVIIETYGSTEVASYQGTIGPDSVVMARAFNFSQFIDSTSSFSSSTPSTIMQGIGLGSDGLGVSRIGDFAGNGWLYFGVRFPWQAGIVYGWVRVNVIEELDLCLIDAYAFNMDGPILAGDQGFIISVEDHAASKTKIFYSQNTINVIAQSSGILDVFNIIGENVWSGKVMGDMQFDVSELPKGAYIVRYSFNSERKLLKFIKEGAN